VPSLFAFFFSARNPTVFVRERARFGSFGRERLSGQGWFTRFRSFRGSSNIAVSSWGVFLARPTTLLMADPFVSFEVFFDPPHSLPHSRTTLPLKYPPPETRTLFPPPLPYLLPHPSPRTLPPPISLLPTYPPTSLPSPYLTFPSLFATPPPSLFPRLPGRSDAEDLPRLLRTGNAPVMTPFKERSPLQRTQSTPDPPLLSAFTSPPSLPPPRFPAPSSRAPLPTRGHL